MEPLLLDKLFDKIFTEASLVAIIFAVMWALERKDRVKAWQAHNDISKQTTEALGQMVTVLEVLKDRLR